MDRRTEVVRAGYEAVAATHLDWSSRIEGDPQGWLVDDFSARLPDGAKVLDLGCGAGVPSTRRLAERFEVVGVDVSRAQLDLARTHVPQATFIEGDLAALTLPAESFEGVTALYSIPHVPREGHAGLFREVVSWLRPGGLLLASLGAGDSPDWTGQWLGAEMFFSSFDAATNRELLREAGFALLYDDVISMREPEGTANFLWVIAQKRPTGEA